MSLYASVSKGTAAALSGLTAVNYAGSPVANNLFLLACTADNAGTTFTISDAGFTSLGADTTSATVQLFGKIVAGSESGSFNVTPSSSTGFAQCWQVSGNPTSLGSIVSGSANQNASSVSSGPNWGALTISTANQLVIALTHAYCNGSVSGGINTPTPWASQVGTLNTTYDFFGWDYVIQTTAASITSGSFTGSYTSTINYATLVIALTPGTGGGGGVIPVNKRRHVYSKTTYHL